jgi:hypothetical protein
VFPEILTFRSCGGRIRVSSARIVRAGGRRMRLNVGQHL